MEHTNEILAALAVLVTALGALVVGRSKASSSPAATSDLPSPVTPAPSPTAPAPSAPKTVTKEKTQREILYDFAKLCFDEKRHCTLDDTIPKEVGCAQAVSYVLKGAGVGGVPLKGISGTYSLWQWLRSNANFKQVTEPMFGDIIISPTGTGAPTSLKHGHVGIVGKWQIMSNNSRTGIWDNHWVMKEWLDYYTHQGGLPTFYFRRLG